MKFELQQRLEALATHYNVPGVVAAVDLAGETRLACHGITHVHHPLPVDERTLFQIASNSKPFTATLILGLVEEHLVALDDPVRKHLPEFRTADPRHAEAVTVRHLLTHRVGWDGDWLFCCPPPDPSLEAILEPMSQARQLVAPGAAFTYSNAGFSVAGRLVEVLTQQPFATALRSRILAPLGMERTCTRADEAIFHRVAMRHLSLPDREPIPLPGGGWQPHWELLENDIPAGGLVSCAEDLLHWLRFWLGRAEPAEGLALPGASLRDEALCEQMPPFNPYEGQAIGWALRYDPGARVYTHGGVTAGYCSITLFVPELDLAAVVLTNSTTGTRLHKELTRELVAELSGVPWRDLEPLDSSPPLERYTGRYWGSFGTTQVRIHEAGGLELETTRHSTEDGSWQPPPEAPARAQLHSPDCAIVTTPDAVAGNLVDFDPDRDPPAWLRQGGRICVRI